jgi:hypothetical protein
MDYGAAYFTGDHPQEIECAVNAWFGRNPDCHPLFSNTVLSISEGIYHILYYRRDVWVIETPAFVGNEVAAWQG